MADSTIKKKKKNISCKQTNFQETLLFTKAFLYSLKRNHCVTQTPKAKK